MSDMERDVGDERVMDGERDTELRMIGMGETTEDVGVTDVERDTGDVREANEGDAKDVGEAEEEGDVVDHGINQAFLS